MPQEGKPVLATDGAAPDPRVELVTSTFVAAGVPSGIRDLGRLIENLNNPAISRHITLELATVRPLYRAASPLSLESPMLVRRSDIIFANFEGAIEDEPRLEPRSKEAACLFMAPPFQIQGKAFFAPGADPAQALRSALSGFVLVHGASVYDADGYMLGQGERIVLNGSAVQMATPSARHIEAFVENAGAARRTERANGRTSAAAEVEEPEQQVITRAA